VIIAIPVMILTYNKFPLTNLAYTLIFIHCVILMIGGHYTYAKTPLGSGCRSYSICREILMIASVISPRDSYPPF